MKRLGPVMVLILLFTLLLVSTADADPGLDGATNALRASSGLPALTTAVDLTAIATQRAFEIAQPDGYRHDFWYADQFCWLGMGENLAYRIPAPDDITTYFIGVWANSPAHLANMLGAYTEQGSGVYLAPDGGAYAAQVFRMPCVAPAPQPTNPLPPIEQVVTVLPNTAMRSLCQTSRTQRPLLNRITTSLPY